MSQPWTKKSCISSAMAFKFFIFRHRGWNVQNCPRNPLGECFFRNFIRYLFQVFPRKSLLRDGPWWKRNRMPKVFWTIILWRGFSYLEFVSKDTRIQRGAVTTKVTEPKYSRAKLGGKPVTEERSMFLPMGRHPTENTESHLGKSVQDKWCIMTSGFVSTWLSKWCLKEN